MNFLATNLKNRDFVVALLTVIRIGEGKNRVTHYPYLFQVFQMDQLKKWILKERNAKVF